MKKALAIVAFVAALFIAGNVQAQSTVYAAYTPETFVTGNTSTNYQGFALGFTQNINLAKDLSVAAGGQFRMNTKSESGSLMGVTGTTNKTQLLIDVPILFNYKIAVNRELAIYPFVGPMPSLAITGTTKFSETLLGTTTTTDWYGDNSNQSRFNLYAVFGADVKFNNFNLFGGYRLGLLDLDKSDNFTLKTNGLFIGLGYTL
ncbi:MAG: outer membrane beta-barrel protein [Bacteroidales bacterium]|nr:outer membrane beta-barrel protein [Bacteroidales bacterium]